MASKKNGGGESGQTNTEKPADLAKPEQAGALAVASAEDTAAYFAAPAIENADRSDLSPPTLHLFQGTSKETDEYGKFEMGDLIDVGEKRKVASREVALVFGQKTWVRWRKGVKQPVYRHTNKANVPPEDLEWPEDGQRNEEGKKGPLATETWEHVVLVKGEPKAYMFRLKVKGLKAARSWLGMVESAKKSGAIAWYELGFTKEKNDEGVFAVPTFRQTGRVDDETRAKVISGFKLFSSMPADARVFESAAPVASDGSEIPI